MNEAMGFPTGLTRDQFDTFLAMIPTIPNMKCSKSFDDIDKDGNGSIDFEEFQSLVEAILEEAHPEKK